MPTLSGPSSRPIELEEIVSQADEIFAQVLAEVGSRRRTPESTYRLQLHSGFPFREALAIVPYLVQLGVTDCYASPYLKAAPGTTHGYDITDHGKLNPEIGTTEEHDIWLSSMRESGLGLVLDVVPNHMGILGNQNHWWYDILENGQASAHSRHFDIDWSAPTRPENRGRVLLPLLGDIYGEVLERGELRLVREGGAFHVEYHDHRFPIDPGSYRSILEVAIGPIIDSMGAEHESVLEFQSILTAIRNLPSHRDTDGERVAERQREKEIIKRRLAALFTGHDPVAEAIDVALSTLNGTPGNSRSFDALDGLLESQPYRLAYWRVGPDEINYRRFFDVNTLAALRTDREDVFRETHALILDILARWDVTGLRIDHPDGLLDPRTYLERLQEAYLVAVASRLHRTGPVASSNSWSDIELRIRELAADHVRQHSGRPDLYVVVEKILGLDEEFPADWRTDGTSGYDALNRLNGLFVDPSGEAEFNRRYRDWIGDYTPYREIVREKKLLILEASLASELHVLAFQLERIALRDRRARDFTQSSLRQALREVIASFPVYRSYITSNSVSDQDRLLVDRAVRSAMRRNPVTSRAIFRFLRNVLLDRVKTPDDLPESEPAPADFAGKFQQVTSPVMAKGLEDTAFYVFNRLVSLNEVGGDPGRFGLSPESFHLWSIERATRTPFALTALSTHDTKRSEDVRARINVLSEMPGPWFDALDRWSAMNAGHRTRIDERDSPDRNEECLFYQTILGCWPFEVLDEEGFARFVERIRAYMAKAIHEAKVNSSWQNPNEEYDQAVDRYVERVLDRNGNGAFLDDLIRFQSALRHHGMINSLSQTLVRLTCPGVPDTYQGTELWDLSLVDPDNRRPVDYAKRSRLLGELTSRLAKDRANSGVLAAELLSQADDGRIKLYILWRVLSLRRDHPGLLSSGEYLPVQTSGVHAQNVLAFIRSHEGRSVIVAVPRLTTRLVSAGQFPMGKEIWDDTTLTLPAITPGTRLRSLFTDRVAEVSTSDHSTVISAAQVFADFPVALLVHEPGD